MAMWITHSWRLLKHEFKRGELNIIAFAIVLSVSSVFSLTGFSAQVKQSLIENSNKFIAADRTLKSSRPVEPEILTQAQHHQLRYVQQAEMSSMLFVGDNMLLVQIKASTEGYPLRGELLVKTNINKSSHPVSIPQNNEVWLDKKALSSLNVTIGDYVAVGTKAFKIAGIIEQLPDASFSVFTSLPVLILPFDNLSETGLVQPGSRLEYKYLFAGEEDNLKAYDEWIKPNLNNTQRWQDIKSGETPLANALNRAEKYLSLASMLGIILAAVAVAVASRRYGQRHQATVATFKALGASKTHVLKVYSLHWALLCLFSIAVGLLVGYLLLSTGLWAIEDLFDISTQQNLAYPVFIAIVTGAICGSCFAFQPLKTLIATSPMLLLRGNEAKSNRSIASIVLAFSSVLLLLYLFSQNIVLSMALLVGTLAVAGVLLIIAHGLFKLGRKIGTQAGNAWHLALANLKRRAKENAVQLISFTVAIKLLLLILVMQHAIIDEWQAQLPENAANRFLININESQKTAVENFYASENLYSSDFFSVVRGRLTAINDENVSKNVSKEDVKTANNGREGIGRELNLTWRETLPAENIIVEGSWWPTDEADATNKSNTNDELSFQQVSVEEKIAQRLELVLGDKLTFMLGSEEINVVVSSIREVNWQSLQPNFYMIFHPKVLADFPATYISSLHVPEHKKQLFQTFLSQFPTISMIDVDAMINQLREVIDQVSVAVKFILVLVVLAGSLVLVAQVQASLEERERELAILKTLGAKATKSLDNHLLNDESES